MSDSDSPHVESVGQSSGSLPARAIACFLVVLVHVNILLRPAIDDWWPGGFLSAPLFAIQVPLFFFLSGYSSRLKKLNLPFFKALRKKSDRLLLPFFAWNIILILIGVRADLVSVDSLLSLLTGTWQLYFIFVLFQFHLITVLMERHLDHRSIRTIVFSAVALSLGFYALADIILWEFGAMAGTMESILNRLIFPWAAFFACGLLLRHEPGLTNLLKKKRKILAAICLPLFFAYMAEIKMESDFAGFNPLKQFLLTGFLFQLSATLLVFSLLQDFHLNALGSRLSRAVSVIGRDSYAIYLSHTSILLILVRCYDRQSYVIPFPLEVPAFALMALLLSIALNRIVRKLPWKIPGMVLLGIKHAPKETLKHDLRNVTTHPSDIGG